ncbi:hypothetical protein PIB30_067355, partial [Stylosanthes scabra]|nr:hypothetical protein [Stylosanthes scabra]
MEEEIPVDAGTVGVPLLAIQLAAAGAPRRAVGKRESPKTVRKTGVEILKKGKRKGLKPTQLSLLLSLKDVATELLALLRLLLMLYYATAVFCAFFFTE